MKQFSSVLNILLVLAVAFLYYLHFSSTKKNTAPVTNAPIIKHDTSVSKGIAVAYVELDSLNNNVGFIKQHKKLSSFPRITGFV